MILPSGRVLIIGFLTAELRSACSRSYLRVSRIRSFHCRRINSSETRHFATNAGGWCPCAELQFVRVYFLGLAKVFLSSAGKNRVTTCLQLRCNVTLQGNLPPVSIRQGQVCKLLKLADRIIVTNVLPPQQARLFAYSRLGLGVRLLFLCRRTHAPNRFAPNPTRPDYQRHFRRRQISSNDVFGTDIDRMRRIRP